MNLLEIQQRMLEAVMQPLTEDETMQPHARDGKSMHDVAGEFIKPNDRLSSFERLEIYNRQYWFRVLAALEEDFKGLRAIVGQKRFEELSRAYLCDCPSASFTLRNLGSGLANWLQNHPKYIQPRGALALDMVRLEWAEIEAFDGAAEAILLPDDVLASDPDPKFRLQPYVQLLSLRYPVDNLLLAIREGSSESDRASNAVSESRKPTRTRKISRQKQETVFLAVHRLDYTVYFKRLDSEAFRLLSALRDGSSLSTAVASAFEGSGIPEAKLLGTVQSWFQKWSELGWFCRPVTSQL